MVAINWHDVLLNSDQDIQCEYKTKNDTKISWSTKNYFYKSLLLTGIMCY